MDKAISFLKSFFHDKSNFFFFRNLINRSDIKGYPFLIDVNTHVEYFVSAHFEFGGIFGSAVCGY